MSCPFCEYAGPSEVLDDDYGAYIIEPINPVTEGHVLVIPKHHTPDFLGDPAALQGAVRLATEWARDKDGDWNLITSKGAAATQTVSHLHLHLVPRREGDGLALPWSSA